ncbi:hypothetical protein L596_005067 [Steinernema carpocapsae]|uniref:Saposin B-type domain-containing protein n=1 Tax=Steinernema carpocapsae TaxID=34508 RepID=A0A4U8UXX0_STECR|nr:hypothetical protein L596_005067 [Steinernema carpocapsae]
MKTVLVVFALLAGSAAFKLAAPVSPKESFSDHVTNFGSACDECKLLVKTFEDAAKDPAKMVTLKALLGLLCKETSYEKECREIVSKLEYFIEFLIPFLDDPEKICKKFHLCSNRKIEEYRKIAAMFAGKYASQEEFENDVVCDECLLAAKETATEIAVNEKDIKRWLSEYVCSYLGELQGWCDTFLDHTLPEVLQELEQFFEKDACFDFDFCKRSTSKFPLLSAFKKLTGDSTEVV